MMIRKIILYLISFQSGKKSSWIMKKAQQEEGEAKSRSVIAAFSVKGVPTRYRRRYQVLGIILMAQFVCIIIPPPVRNSEELVPTQHTPNVNLTNWHFIKRDIFVLR